MGTRRKGHVIGYGVFAAVAAFLHYSAAIPIAAVGLVWFAKAVIRKDGWREYRTLIVANLPAVAIIAAMYFFHVRKLAGLYSAVRESYVNSFFVSNLASPKRAGRACDKDVALGEQFFTSIGCAACHVPTLQGSDGPVNLYSDLLLHETLPEQKDEPEIVNRRQPVLKLDLAGEPRIVHISGGNTPLADEPEPAGIRTPPLWGVRKTAPSGSERVRSMIS